jgi:DNA mismatch endonuclease (patch repair protein)
MADIYSRKVRSKIMASIPSKETKPEITVRSFLFKQGFRFRNNVNILLGKPDIVLPKYRTVIFVNGCFWHGHKKCKASALPETRKEFWTNKLKANIDRDKRNIRELKKAGWKTIIIWQCEIKNRAKRERRFEKLRNEISGSQVKKAKRMN